MTNQSEEILDDSLLKLISQGNLKEGVGASDMITGEGAIEDYPRFLVEALKKISYRLHQAGMWSNDNDIKLYIPGSYFIEFVYVWTRYLFSLNLEVEPRQIVEEDFVIIDNIRIRIQKSLSDRYYLVVVRVGADELIKWDSKSGQWLFRAPWAIAGYEVTSD